MDSQVQLTDAARPCLKMPDQETSQAIHFHLESMTTVIERMAGNSESSKTWCISLVSAIVVVASEEKMPQIFSLAFLPTLMFFVLDVYYLSLERGFRSSYTDFVKKLHSGTWEFEDLYLFDPGNVGPQILRAIGSFSVWPFYGLLASGIIFVSFVFVPRS
jgi:hypothetical protein